MNKLIPSEEYPVTPYFTVKDADRLIAFACTVFGAVVVKENRYDNGTVQHVRLQIGKSLLMLNETTDAFPANVSQMYLRVKDAEAVYAHALREGAVSLMEPNDRPFGARMAGIKDPCGNVWWIATPISHAQ